jgi:UDP-N-acetylmuramoyl-tripeptide--D-alanyl-D-alanine ligase
MTFTVAELARVADAVPWTREEWSAVQAQPIHHVVVDSRRAQPHALFVALVGARADGHDFLADAFAGGAGAALIAAAQWQRRRGELQAQANRHGAVLLITEDPLMALHRIAADHRSRRSAARIAVTGSNGKTTTRHILGSILAQHAATYETERNFNSDIGLPLAIMGIEHHHRLAVLELGIDRTGEMDLLGKLALPHHALITGIGSAHIGPLGSRARIADEKSRVFTYLHRGGRAFVPEQEELLDRARLPLAPDVTVVRFGPTTTPGYEGSEPLGLEGSLIHWEGLQIHFPLFGSHNVANVLAAITVASTLGVSAAAIQQGIEAVRPMPGRSQVIRGRITIVNDAYNANPESMAAAVSSLTSVPDVGRVLVVLGSMLELGAASAAAHAALGSLLAAVKADAVFLFGRETEATAAVLAHAGYDRPLVRTCCFAELERAVVAALRPGDTVLLKGSRAVALDRLVPALEAA